VEQIEYNVVPKQEMADEALEKELEAILAVGNALKGLPSDAVGRIARWVFSYWQIEREGAMR
jgi:hypothetical protein